MTDVKTKTLTDESIDALQRGQKVPVWLGGDEYLVLTPEP